MCFNKIALGLALVVASGVFGAEHPLITPANKPWIARYHSEKTGVQAVAITVANGTHTSCAANRVPVEFTIRLYNADPGNGRYIPRVWEPGSSVPSALRIQGCVDAVKSVSGGGPPTMKKIPLKFDGEGGYNDGAATHSVIVRGFMAKDKKNGGRGEYRVHFRLWIDPTDKKSAKDDPCSGPVTDDILEESAPINLSLPLPYDPTAPE